MFCGSFLAFAGTVVQSLAIGYAQFIVGRYLIGVGIGFILVAGPSLTAELAHPRQRGMVLGGFQYALVREFGLGGGFFPPLSCLVGRMFCSGFVLVLLYDGWNPSRVESGIRIRFVDVAS